MEPLSRLASSARPVRGSDGQGQEVGAVDAAGAAVLGAEWAGFEGGQRGGLELRAALQAGPSRPQPPSSSHSEGWN